jgi:hypothetical protein
MGIGREGMVGLSRLVGKDWNFLGGGRGNRGG